MSKKTSLPNSQGLIYKFNYPEVFFISRVFVNWSNDIELQWVITYHRLFNIKQRNIHAGRKAYLKSSQV
jgi:hypothetical protein